jgi:hypothetical protein
MTERDQSRKTARGRKHRDGLEIDQNLRRVYEDMVDDSIPDRFLELLQKLRDEGKTP